MNIKIGAKIKELRTRENITQQQLAEILGVTNQAVSKWEGENGYPDIEYIVLLADYFNVTTDYLLGYAGSKKRHKILIFDKYEICIKMFSGIFEQKYEIVVAESLNKLPEVSASEQPDLILADLFQSVPRDLGFEILTSLKTSENTRDIPVIIITKSDFSDRGQEEIRCLNLGAVDYIDKPFRPDVLKVRVATRLRIAKQA